MCPLRDDIQLRCQEKRVTATTPRSLMLSVRIRASPAELRLANLGGGQAGQSDH